MQLRQPEAELFVPDGAPLPGALSRTTHLGIGAHQDDLEIMAAHGILACYQRADLWFTGVTMTTGGGTPRSGPYAGCTDAAMTAVRNAEQRKAAFAGEYAAQFLLAYPSASVKDLEDPDPAADLAAILEATRPETVYTHNLADKHDTHVGVALHVIAAIRRMPPGARPRRVLGCEVWRDLDWLPESEKIALDCSGHAGLQAALVGVFDSQISGGKRYDLATAGRRRAHATYHDSHDTDQSEGLIFAMDLTPLVQDETRDPLEHARGLVRALEADIAGRFGRIRGARR